jgi:uncharacterized DUF497 family protein
MQIVEKIAVTEFDWDPDKRIRTLEERGLDFADGARALLEPHLEYRSDRHGEHRTLGICGHTMRIIAVVYTLRDDLCRIISVRPARKNEQREFRQIFGR